MDKTNITKMNPQVIEGSVAEKINIDKNSLRSLVTLSCDKKKMRNSQASLKKTIVKEIFMCTMLCELNGFGNKSCVATRKYSLVRLISIVKLVIQNDRRTRTRVRMRTTKDLLYMYRAYCAGLPYESETLCNNNMKFYDYLTIYFYFAAEKSIFQD